MKATLFAVFTFLGCASAATDAERAIRAQYDVLERAFAAQDVATILATRDPAFETFGPQGQRDDFARMAEYTRQWFVTNKPPIESRFTIESIEMRSPDEAAVRVLQRASRMQERDGVLHKVEHEVRQRETWIRTPNGWKLRKVDEIDLANRKRWVDGVLERWVPPETIEREIRVRYDEIERAYAAQDVETVLATFDPRLEDYARREELVRQWFAASKPPIEYRITMEALDIRPPDNATVSVLEQVSRYQPGEDGRLVQVRQEARRRESWVRTPTGWKRRKIEEIVETK